MKEPGRLKRLQQTANEAELRKKVLEPLFERMGFGVVDTHGHQEHGKDFVLSYKDELLNTTKLAAVIVKKGNIVVGTKKRETNLLNDISRQVKEAFNIKYPNPDTKRVESISKAYVVTDGNISPNAERIIAEDWGSSKELFEKNTEFIRGPMLVHLINDHWEHFFISNEPELNEYCTALNNVINEENNTTAIPVKEEIRTAINKCFPARIYKVETDDESLKHVPHNPEKVFKEKKYLIIVGPSGSGKSFLLREEIRKAITEECLAEHETRLIVYARFTEIADIDQNISGLKRFIVSKTQSICKTFSERKIKSIYSNKMVDFYLDGFDEIGIEEKRKSTIKLVELIKSHFPDSKIFVTTRECDFISNQGFPEYFERYDLPQLNYKEAIKYIEGIVIDIPETGKDIIKEIKQQGLIQAMPRTPLALQLISILFSEKAANEIPSNITEIYRMYSEIMLGRWDKERDVTNIFDYEQKIALLENIADFFQQNVREDITREEAINFTKNFLENMGMSGNKAEQLLNEIVERSELLIHTHDDLIKFKHRSFQEYMVANKYYDEGLPVLELNKKIADPWWENVIVYLCGFRRKADPILLESIKDNSVEGIPEEIYRFRRGKNLGNMVRAGYQSSVGVKKDCIKVSLNDFEFCYNSPWVEESKKIISGRFPESFVLMGFQTIFSRSYYSKFLAKPLLDIADIVETNVGRAIMICILGELNEIDKVKELFKLIDKSSDLNVKRACVDLINYLYTDENKVKLIGCKEFRKLQKKVNVLFEKKKDIAYFERKKRK